MMTRVAARTVALALAGAVLATACSSTSAETIRLSRISGPMPVLAGPAVNGGTVDHADYAGKVVLVNFWASWCGPCTREQPGLEALWRRVAGRGDVAFIGVDERDGVTAARAFLARFKVTYPSVADPQGAMTGPFGVVGLPVTVLVDRRGQLRYRLLGAQDPLFVLGLLVNLGA